MTDTHNNRRTHKHECTTDDYNNMRLHKGDYNQGNYNTTGDYTHRQVRKKATTTTVTTQNVPLKQPLYESRPSNPQNPPTLRDDVLESLGRLRRSNARESAKGTSSNIPERSDVIGYDRR